MSTHSETSVASEARSGWSSYRSIGIEAIISEFEAQKGLRVLDLGASHASTLNVYSRFAKRIEFLDLLTEEENFPISEENFAHILSRVPSSQFDLIMCWDVLNYFRPEDFEKVCATLAKSCSANGKIHFLGWHRPQMASRPLEFILEEDLDVYFNSKSKNTLNSIEWKKAKLPKIFQDCVIERTFLTRAGIEEFVLMRACES